jgi:fibronectin type 3 domain-containing protein
MTGLDQVNLAVPGSLVGRGEVPVALEVDGRPANVVTVNLSVGAGDAGHWVLLRWAPGAQQDGLAGYNIYRSTNPGGPYVKLSPALTAGTAFVDTSVVGGETYYYVATAVDGAGDESDYSNEARAVVPR